MLNNKCSIKCSYVDLNYENVGIATTVLGDCQFLAKAIIRPNVLVSTLPNLDHFLSLSLSLSLYIYIYSLGDLKTWEGIVRLKLDLISAYEFCLLSETGHRGQFTLSNVKLVE